MLFFNSSFSQTCEMNFSIGNDTILYCEGSFALQATPEMDSYEWNTGSSESTITVSNSGTYSCTAKKLGPNVVVNGDFSDGNIGFDSDYILGTSPGGTYGPLSAEGTYMINFNSMYAHTNFVNCNDHTIGDYTGKMMVVNGAATTGVTIWEQTITVVPNTKYLFSIWANSVHIDNPGKFAFSINGQQLGTDLVLTSNTCQWDEFNDSWNSGTATTAVIAIENLNTNGSGNDFALDDISFRPICEYTEEVEINFYIPDVSVPDTLIVCPDEALPVTAISTILGVEFTWLEVAT